MTIRQGEIEALVEDLIETTILDIFQAELNNRQEGKVALEILKQQLEELDITAIDELFD